LPEHVANLRVARALAGLGLLAATEAKARQLERADRNLDHAIAIGRDDRLLGDDLGQVALQGLLHLFVMPRLVDRTLPMQRPILLTHRERT